MIINGYVDCCCVLSQTLLSEGVDVNILDYKGATPLHRAKDAATVEVTWRFCLRPIIRFLLLL